MNPPLKQKCVPALGRDLIPPPARKTRATAGGRSKEGRFYKPLPKELQHGGFIYRQIYREGDSVIYQQTWKGNDDSAGFEVLRIRYRDEFWIGGKFIEAHEVYPNSEAWGVNGFTFTDWNKAWARFVEISLEEPARRERQVKNGKIVQEVRRQR